MLIIYLIHTDLLFHSLNLLKLTDIGQIQTLTFMYKYHHGVLPTTFVNYFCKVADVHSYLLVSLPVYTFLMQEQTKGKIPKNYRAQVVE